MKPKFATNDPDIVGSWPAMQRAARRAKQLAIQTGTPFLVMRNGKLVNLNPDSKPKGRRKWQKKRRA